jgi:hypothetical protein
MKMEQAGRYRKAASSVSTSGPTGLASAKANIFESKAFVVN